VKPPRIVELVGVAGAGKTTLAHTLSTNTNRIILCDHPYFRNVSDIPFFTWNTLMMAPVFIKIFITSGIKSITPREMAWMVILNGWHQRLRRQSSKDPTIVVLDQGPIAIFAELYTLHHNVLQSQSVKKWWDRTLTDWAHTLDLLVCLDTSDPVLIERVRNRNTWHLIKDQSDCEALDLNSRFRSINSNLISRMMVDIGGPSIIEFDTGKSSVHQITEKTLLALDIENLTTSTML
jgi:deoxyadenosine/deoxycytidine kinase